MGKMNQIARCDWLPERARWSQLARSGLPAVSRKKNFAESHIINPLLTKFVWSRWLDIDLVLFLWVYGPRLRLGPYTRKKKNLANIQPSWPHTWSITHIHNLQPNVYTNRYRLSTFRRMELFGEKRAKLLSKLVSAVQLTDPENFVCHIPGIEAYGKKIVWLKWRLRNIFPL